MSSVAEKISQLKAYIDSLEAACNSSDEYDERWGEGVSRELYIACTLSIVSDACAELHDLIEASTIQTLVSNSIAETQ